MKKAIKTMLIAALAAFVLAGCGQEQAAQEDFRVAVTLAEVSRGDLTISDRLSGTARAAEEVSLSAGTPAEVEEILVSAGQDVDAGDVLVRLDDESVRNQIDQAEAGYNMARLQLESARENYEKSKRLYEEGAMSFQQYDSARAQYEQVRDGSFEQARVALDMARQALDGVVITAPIDGTVGFVEAQVGQQATPGAPIASVIDLSRMEAEFGLSEKQINQVDVGARIDIFFDSVREEPFAGVIREASPQMDERTKSFPVTVAVDNPDSMIKSGMSCTISLVQQTVRDALIIPEDAIRHTSARDVVFVLDGESVREVEVNSLLSDGTDTAVTAAEGSLLEADRIVVLGKERLDDGSEVRIVNEGGAQ